MCSTFTFLDQSQITVRSLPSGIRVAKRSHEILRKPRVGTETLEQPTVDSTSRFTTDFRQSSVQSLTPKRKCGNNNGLVDKSPSSTEVRLKKSVRHSRQIDDALPTTTYNIWQIGQYAVKSSGSGCHPLVPRTMVFEYVSIRTLEV